MDFRACVCMDIKCYCETICLYMLHTYMHKTKDHECQVGLAHYSIYPLVSKLCVVMNKPLNGYIL